MKCNTCGIEDSEFAGKGEFLNHCRQCKKQATESDPDNISEVIKAALDGVVEDFDNEPDAVDDAEILPEPDNTISIPLSICPNVISYLPDNQLIKIVVVGRKQGDRFIVKETKYK